MKRRDFNKMMVAAIAGVTTGVASAAPFNRKKNSRKKPNAKDGCGGAKAKDCCAADCGPKKDSGCCSSDKSCNDKDSCGGKDSCGSKNSCGSNGCGSNGCGGAR